MPVQLPSTFDRCFELVIGSEGGYVNNPKDPGGETKYGISKRAYPELEIGTLTLEEAKQIYFKDYYTKVTEPGAEFPTAYPVFDTSVLHGVTFTLNLLKTIAQRKSPDFQETFLLARALAEQEDRNWSLFRKGWTKRLILVLAVSLSE